MEDLSLYGTYIESFEQGGTAGDTYRSVAVTNAGEIMDPLTSTQIEIGAKYSHNNMFYTLALFNIDKGLEYYDVSDASAYKYVQDGRQVHRGLEFTFSGKVIEDLTSVGGFTILDAKIKENKNNPSREGTTPKEVANHFAKLYLEYTPFEKKNISLNTGINYTGSFFADHGNTEKLDAYTLVNLGGKYTSRNTKYPMTYRLNINNITDKQYWLNSSTVGNRRTVHASVTMKF